MYYKWHVVAHKSIADDGYFIMWPKKDTRFAKQSFTYRKNQARY